MDLESQTILTNIIRGMVLNSGTNEFDIIIIGGGATGAGTARDCSLRGMRVLLVERFDFAAGATGRNHGLLHSGARYAVTDRESAAECIKENMILRKIARHCVEETVVCLSLFRKMIFPIRTCLWSLAGRQVLMPRRLTRPRRD